MSKQIPLLEGNVEICPVAVAQTYSLRQQVLRPGRELSTCFFDGDEHTQTRHFAVMQKQTALAIASVYAVDHSAIAAGSGWQLRGMASDESVRGKGFGAALVAAVEDHVRSCAGDYLWANARIEALAFYQKLGYQSVGELFDIVDVGPHKLIVKQLLN